MDAQLWDRLSESSKKALRWAAALSNCRQGGKLQIVSPEAVDVFDLFVGLYLAHPDKSELKTLLTHFNLTLGQILPDSYHRPDDKALERALKSIPKDTAPSVDPDVSTILNTAQSLHTSVSKSNVIEHRFVFAAMLEGTHLLQESLQERVDQLGSMVSDISRTTRNYLSNGSDQVEYYAKLLQKKHPVRLRPVELPSYQSDHGQKVDLSRDLIGIRAEVDAFAYLLGSRDLNPPLAIGLFGDWGSGKSFFMEAVESRISNLTDIARDQNLAQKDIPFWKHIIQIRFNAWHYVESVLWASLVEHIFSQLKLASDEKQDIVEKRRQYWAMEITGKRKELEDIESEHQEKQKEQKKCQEAVANLRKQQDSELKELERLKSRKIAEHLVEGGLVDIRQALEPHFAAAGVKTFGDAVRSIQEAKRELRQGATLFRRCTEDRWMVVLIIAALILVPILIYWIQKLNLGPYQTFLSDLAAAVSPVVVMLHRTTNWVRKQRERLQKAETDVLNQMEVTRNNWNNEIEAAEDRATRLSGQLNDNRQRQVTLTGEIAELEKRRDSITAVGLTNEFIAERTGSDDYRELLGLPALIQKDFETLSELVKRQNREILNNSAKIDSDHIINRIILYIDDLDRCPEKQVIQVLQAVHLLLAFDLFVVVVAVDARWLNHALVEYYPALVDRARNGDQATADDYLEKIFQIPFWIEPLGDDAKRNIVDGLLRAQLAGSDGGEIKNQEESALKMTEAHKRILDTITDRSEPLSLNASDLSVSPDEVEFLDSLAPVLGDTPRSVKRFVNLYQLLRIIHHSEANDEQAVPKDHAVLALVLAIGNGMPRLAHLLFKSFAEAETNTSLSSVLLAIDGDYLNQGIERLKCWIQNQPVEWGNMSCNRLVPLVAMAERFLFRVGGRAIFEPADTNGGQQVRMDLSGEMLVG